MTRPNLVLEREPSTISHDEGRTTAIVTSKRRTVLLQGRAARQALAGRPPVIDRSVRRALTWDRDPVVLSDLPITGATVWSNATQLVDLVARTTLHAYMVCARHPAALVDGLLRPALAAPLTPLVIYAGRALVGPTFRSEPWPCRRCWVRTLCRNLPSLAERVNRGHSILVPQGLDVERILATARVLWEAPVARRRPDMAMIIDLEDGTVSHQRLLPVPGCTCVTTSTPGALEDAVGDMIGRYTAVGNSDPRAPLPLRTAVSRVAPYASGGACAIDPVIAQRRALAEAAERFAASHVGERTERASHRAIGAAPPIAALWPYSNAQYAEPGFRYTRLSPDETLDWIAGYDWQTGQTVYLPAGLVTLDPRYAAPFIAPCHSTGLAAGPSEPAVAISALLEVVERDVVTRGWYRGAARALSPEQWAPHETRRLTDAGLIVHLALCPNAHGAPVAVAFVAGTRGGALGCAAGVTLAHAAIHAIEEAALMFSHRSQRQRLLSRRVAWPALTAADSAVVRAHASADLSRVTAHYQPVIISLSTRDTAAISLCVARAWSSRAVDFIGPRTPLPLRRWRPDATARARIARGPELFTSLEKPEAHGASQEAAEHGA